MSDSNDLIAFIASMSGEGNLRVEENLGDGYVKLRVSEAERRQAKHDIQSVEDIVIEMLRNARDAGADRVYIATSKEEGVRTLLFLDNGSGVPVGMRERIFDARVTSKLETMKMDKWGVHGRGMALFSIKQNARSAEVLTSGPGLGSVFRVVVDCTSLKERVDQSTWPQAEKNDDGVFVCTRRTITLSVLPASSPWRSFAAAMCFWDLQQRLLPLSITKPVASWMLQVFYLWMMRQVYR